ncbi:MAG TPA: TetR/AcrR family transcriptional regulator [Candidatus Dormibacteraeota bacterium]|nr:TetR/AcrR family transcriptional regulator [Candidatus Dormibacteraeota bacterium]
MADVATLPQREPIPRGPRARERVLRAALEVLAERGMPGFTMEAVAQRAGASKATLYRHWRSQAALLIDALDLVIAPFEAPATGTLRGDVLELLSRLEVLVGTQPYGRLMAAFVDAAERDPALAGLQDRISESRRAPLRRILGAARDRGELPAATDIELAVDLFAGPAFYRRFVVHGPFPKGYSQRLVDLVLRGLGASSSPHDR